MKITIDELRNMRRVGFSTTYDDDCNEKLAVRIGGCDCCSDTLEATPELLDIMIRALEEQLIAAKKIRDGAVEVTF